MSQSPFSLEDRRRARLMALLDELRALSNETEWVEFKHNNADPKMVGECISALANSARLHSRDTGYMVWGVDNDTHAIVGTSFDPDSTVHNQPFKFWLAQRLMPSPPLDFQTIVHPGGRVVLLQVPASTELPVAFDRIARIRIGSATPPLRDYPEIEKRLLAKLRPFVWEQGPAADFLTGEEVLDLLDHDAFLRLRGVPRPTEMSGVLRRLSEAGMIVSDARGHWTILNIGAILLARDLARFPTLERKSLRIIQYSGLNRVQAKPEQSWTQGYAAGFAASLKFLEGILPAREVIGTVRVDEHAYPSEAVKELLANTLIHQDMTITGAGPKVEVFKDRIEFNNPGEPVTDWRKLFGAEPRSRNEGLAFAMRKMDLCEERGSGLRRIIEATDAVQLLPPEFQVYPGSTRVILHGYRREFDGMDQETRTRAIYYYSMLLWERNVRLTNTLLRSKFRMTGSATVKASAALRLCVDNKWIKVADPDRPNSGYVPFWA